MPSSSATRTYLEIRDALLRRREIALLDVREECDHAQGHPLFAANLPLARIEADAPALLPRRDVPIVLIDDAPDSALARRAAGLLRPLGYTDLALLDGGVAGWARDGGELFRDVNAPSKAFGELVEAEAHTPSLPPEELARLLRPGGKADIRILDARRFDEYQTMSIPGGISVPGGELALRVRDLAPDPRTTVIVNCAGRTRSLIGAQSLINAGIPNRVLALRNGTIGWTLAGLPLATGQSARFGSVSETARLAAARSARDLARRAGVRHVTHAEAEEWRHAPGRTTYHLDVRTPEDHAAGHLPGYRSAPGGQLVQETDMFIPVRGARVVLADDDGVRARMTASWLAQMDWEVYVLDPMPEGRFTASSPLPPPRPAPAAGRYRRPYEGAGNPREAMQAYLEWEYGLVAQLARDGAHHFRVLRPASGHTPNDTTHT